MVTIIYLIMLLAAFALGFFVGEVKMGYNLEKDYDEVLQEYKEIIEAYEA